MVMPVVGFYKVDELPVEAEPNAFYYIQRTGYVEAWLTTNTGDPVPIGAIAAPQWGEIEGDIELQADLMGLLAAKQDSASLGSAAFADASSFATAAQGLLAENAQPKEAGKGLSEENYTPAEKEKLGGVAVEATKNRADSENADKVHTHSPAEMGLGEVDNTSDEDKPMSRAQRAAMASKFNRGDVAQEVGDNSSKVISQKASTEAFYRAGSGVVKAGKIHIQSTAPTVDVEDGDIWLKI